MSLLLDGSAQAPVLALDLGASRIRAAVILPDGTVEARSDGPTRVADGPAAVIADAIALLIAVRDEVPDQVARAIAAIGISAPGPLDAAAGRFRDTPNLGPAFAGQPFAGPIGDALALPAVLERDTVVALLGELAFGAARGASNAIYVTVSTGIGGAILADGRLLGGADGLAGEIGHLVVELDGPVCGCGGRGHLEGLSSGSGLARSARQLIESGQAPGLERLAREAGSPLTARDLAAAEASGDPDAAALLDRARRAFAAAMSGLVNVFNPEAIVVGGSLARGQGERWLGPARAAIATESFEAQAARVRLVPAQLGDDVGLVGALGLIALRSESNRA